MGDEAIDARQARLWFWGLLALAVALRIAAFNAYSAHHPDETIQYLEQAHRIVFGYGVVPWEFRYFIRSWFLPLLLVPPMQLGEWLDPGGTLYLILPRIMIAALNLTPVWAAWVIGRRLSRSHAVVAMAVTALWVECILFSVQILSESLAVSAFMAAAALLHREAGRRALIAAGALMALAGLMRFQFGPAIAVYAALIAGKDKRLWAGLLLGGVPVVIAGGLLDVVMGLRPYEWVLTNYRMNIAQGRMKEIGGFSTTTYLLAPFYYWKWAMAVIPLLAFKGARANWPLAVAALVNIAVHQLIGHKEYRYLWFSVQIIMFLAAVGSLDLARQIMAERGRPIERSPRAVPIIVGLWAALSLSLALTATYWRDWRVSGDSARLARRALSDPGACGLAVPREPYTWFGYSLVHQNKPLFLVPSRGDTSLYRSTPIAPAFNRILVPPGDAPPGFPVALGCSAAPGDRLCLYARPGGCRIDPTSRPYLFQETLLFFDM